jgi:hypothetical protein
MATRCYPGTVGTESSSRGIEVRAMKLDLREMFVCLVTVMAVLAATVIAVGAVATYSFYVHATSPQRDAGQGTPIVLALASDPCLAEPAFAVRPATPASETGLQCPIYRSDQG